MANDTLPAFIQYFLGSENYPHPVDEVELVQTHISYVLLAGDFVYKFKKPVDFGFLDFTSLEKRRFFCHQELLLNRRLCPEIYLDVVTVCEEQGKLSLGGPGTPVEYAVKMRRMPEDRMMPLVIKDRLLTKDILDGVVDVLTPFYKTAADNSEIQGFGNAEAVSVNVLENFSQTEDFVGSSVLSKEQFEAISSFSRDFLSRVELFQSRIDAGRIRDCHGDLYSANICLADKIYIFDCIEFNERFRYCDVASDVAFLAMDLDFHGLEGLSDYFINRFVAASGDSGLEAMLNFYKCYRAYVRGKIGLFTASAPEVDESTKQKCLSEAGRYFTLAGRYAAG